MRLPLTFGRLHDGYYPHSAVAALVLAITSADRQHVQTDQAAPDAALLPWLTHNPGDLTSDRLNVICPGADVVILEDIEAGLARLIAAEHNDAISRRADLAATSAPTEDCPACDGSGVQYPTAIPCGLCKGKETVPTKRRLGPRTIVGEDAIIASLKAETRACPLDEWHEDMGDCVWWCWQDGTWLGEPAMIGNPLDSAWPGYHTHFTPHPAFPARLDQRKEAGA